MFSQVSLIHAEIDFWREMIESTDRAHTDQALERMRMALMLAERKLLALDTKAPGPDIRAGERIDSKLQERN